MAQIEKPIKARYTYRDFVSGKSRWTGADFMQWTPPMGPLNVPYAVFSRPKSDLLIPQYCLTPETLAKIGHPEAA